MPADFFRNKNLRVDLEPGEVFDLTLDCLQLQVRRPEEVAAGEIDVNLGDFSLAGVFDEVASEFTMSDEVLEAVRGKCLSLFNLAP